MASPPLIPPRLREAVEWLVQQVLAVRPRFYNGITWTLVVSGTLLIASPLWERILSAVLERSFNLRLTGGGHDTAWGFALVVCGLLYHLVMQGMTQRQELRLHAGEETNRAQRLEHDRAIFGQLQNTVSERTFLNLLEFLGCNHGADKDELSRLSNFIEFIEQPSHQFITPPLREHTDQLLQALRQLNDFVGRNFFCIRNQLPADGLFLQPDLNIDRGGRSDDMERYGEYAETFHDLIDATRLQYSKFREAVKYNLAV